MENETEEIQNLKNCCTTLDTLIELDKRAVEDLENDTHNIGQEEVITIIREFIRCKNDYEYIKKKYIPRYLIKSIRNDLNKILKEE